MSDQDRQRFVWLVAEYFFLVEGLFKQQRRGFLSAGTWSARGEAEYLRRRRLPPTRRPAVRGARRFALGVLASLGTGQGRRLTETLHAGFMEPTGIEPVTSCLQSRSGVAEGR